MTTNLHDLHVEEVVWQKVKQNKNNNKNNKNKLLHETSYENDIDIDFCNNSQNEYYSTEENLFHSQGKSQDELHHDFINFIGECVNSLNKFQKKKLLPFSPDLFINRLEKIKVIIISFNLSLYSDSNYGNHN